MGRVYKPTYTVKGPNGERITKTSEHYHIEFTDAGGRTVHRKAGKFAAAKDALTKAEAEVLAEKNGLPTRSAKNITMKELCTNYLSSLKSRVSVSHYTKTERYLKEVRTQCRFFAVKDIRPEAVERYLDQLAEERDLGSVALNTRLDSINALLNWAVHTRLLPYNPLDCIKKREKVRRWVRRAMSEGEISKLLAAALDGPHRRFMRIYQNRPRKDGSFKPITLELPVQAELAKEGRNNALVFRLMLETGLRRGEAKAVTWADIDLDAGTLTTRPEWIGNKNGKKETIPLTPGLRDAMMRRKKELAAAPNDRVVKMTDRTLDHLNDDLVAAGMARRVPIDKEGHPIEIGADGKPIQKPKRWIVDNRDASGRKLDLHALRHTFGTRLGAMPGIDPKTVQTLMRHSDPRLTFGVYVHSDKGRLRNAVDSLPELAAAVSAAPDVSIKTGTDDIPVSNVTPIEAKTDAANKASTRALDGHSNTFRVSKLSHAVRANHTHEVGGSSPSVPIVISPAEYASCVYLPHGSAAATQGRKRIVLYVS
jgi:integrase